ncbi:MAG: hypothetical protein Q7T81_15840 [Pseudolabrys sp.]|nr:hypothetical protein [Pseudolabrys sp.]
MAAHKRIFTPEQIAEAKRLYESTGTPTRDISALLGICNSTLIHRANEWKWRKRAHVYRSTDMARMVRGAIAAQLSDPNAEPDAANAQPVSGQQRSALAQRIQAVVERQMAVVEQIVGIIGPADRGEAESSVRLLAGISRTLRDVAALNQPDDEMAADGSDDDDDDFSGDIDELRRRLAKRLRLLVDVRLAAQEQERDRGRAFGAEEENA